jgi:hypothetical protein
MPFLEKTESYALENETQIVLSDTQTTVDGQAISTSSEDAVYEGADIIYYEDGHDASYGDGTASEAHSESEAAENTVITITQPGTYRISGTLSKGQLAVDLGEDASDDSDAVVTLILDGADITCTVAPAVIFYNVWESESDAQAGAVVTLADDTVNTVNGSHVAKIYKEGTTKKRYKFDGAFYSKMTMSIGGESKNNGELDITADNEGLDSEMHLTVNGGTIKIHSEDDGINTNEDDVSIFTMNDGYLYVNAGNGSEGDGIDSNGSIAINGGTIISVANASSPDGGLDADNDILINGGTVVALGINSDEISSKSTAPFLQLSYEEVQPAEQITYLTDTSGTEILAYVSEKTYQSAVIASPQLNFDTTYYLYNGGTLTGVEEQDGLYATGGVYSDGIKQQYSNNADGGMTKPDGDNGVLPDGNASPGPEGSVPSLPEGSVPSLPEGSASPGPEGSVPSLPEGSVPSLPEGSVPSLPDGSASPGSNGGAPAQPEGNTVSQPNQSASTANQTSYSTEFTITQETRSFRQVSATQEKYEISAAETPGGETPASETPASETPASENNVTAAGTTSSTGNDTVGGSSDAIKKVTVKKTVIKSVKRSKSKKKMTVTIKKVKKADGYQIRYSTSKKFTKATTKKVKLSKNKIKKILSLQKAKKTYYVSVRVCRKVDGSNYYSGWSAAKTVKAK